MPVLEVLCGIAEQPGQLVNSLQSSVRVLNKPVDCFVPNQRIPSL